MGVTTCDDLSASHCTEVPGRLSTAKLRLDGCQRRDGEKTSGEGGQRGVRTCDRAIDKRSPSGQYYATRATRRGVRRCQTGTRPRKGVVVGHRQASEEVIGMMTYAQRMDRIGTETAFEVLARAKALEAEGRAILHFEIGEPD